MLETFTMKLSTCDAMQDKLTPIGISAVNVKVEIAPCLLLASIITIKPCEGLEFGVGENVSAVVKTSSVMTGID